MVTFKTPPRQCLISLNLATEGSGVGQWEPMIALAGGKGRGANVGRDRVGGPKGNRVLMRTGYSWAKHQREMGRKKKKQCKACCRKRQT